MAKIIKKKTKHFDYKKKEGMLGWGCVCVCVCVCVLVCVMLHLTTEVRKGLSERGCV